MLRLIARKIVSTGEETVVGILLGIVGVVIDRALFTLVEGSRLTDFNLDRVYSASRTRRLEPYCPLRADSFPDGLRLLGFICLFTPKPATRPRTLRLRTTRL